MVPRIIDISAEKDQLKAATDAVVEGVTYHQLYQAIPPGLVIKTSDPNVIRAASGLPVGDPSVIGGPFAYFQSNLGALRGLGVEVIFEEV